jgi:2,3-bisphosphoglycerate-independent phosphoglycerate mutase
MEYDRDLHIPGHYLVTPPRIEKTISESGCRGCPSIRHLRDPKFGHVTYFWNGNLSGKFNDALETYEDIPSDKVTFDQRPWMKAADITDRVIQVIREGKYPFVRLNFPNGDMVGHTGDFHAAVVGMETVDLALKRILPVVKECGGIAILTADHGNLDEMFELDKKGKVILDKESGEPAKRTAHTLNPVPFIIYDPQYNGEYELADVSNPGLSNVAATLLNLLGYDAPEDYRPSLIKMK